MNVRRTVIAALVTIVILAVVLFIVSKYVQPVLPYGLNSDFLLIAACLIAVATFLAALKDSVYHGPTIFAGPKSEPGLLHKA